MNMPNFKNLVLAIDVGGTKIAFSLVSQAGEVVSRIYLPTQASLGPKSGIARMLKVVKKLLQKTGLEISNLAGVSIAIAGIVDTKRGMLTYSPNLPGWHNIPLREIFARELDTKIYIINDASAAALGEYHFGAGKGYENIIYITISTGIGGGIIIGGCLYEGTNGCAGEIGHMIVDSNGPECNCGNHGCLEALSSGTAITRDVVNKIKQGNPSSVLKLAKNSMENIDARIIAEAAKKGDIIALNAIRQASYYLGLGLINLIHIFNPQLIVIGGGVSSIGNLYLLPAKKLVRERAFALPAKNVRIVRAKLGKNSGVIGAACLAFPLDSVKKALE